jgi:hypothetical protein
MKSLFLITVILSVIAPATAYGQTTVLNSTATPNQCLDFNGDGTCEYIVLANGTQIANPLPAPTTANQTNQSAATVPPEEEIEEFDTTEEWEEANNRDFDGDDNDNDNNDNDSDDLPQEGGCQEFDDYCDRDEGCHREDVDCIDDRGFDEDDYDG